MERIFQIKTKSDRDPRCQYPSERRYSASIVIGLSVVFLQLFLFSTLMGTLIIHKMTINPVSQNEAVTDGPDSNDTTTEEDRLQRLYDKLERDLDIQKDTQYFNIDNNIPALVCAGCFMMSLGYFLSFVTGLLAWKQWYIDHNITFFFLTTSFSSLTSSLSLLLSVLACMSMNFNYDEYQYETNNWSPVTFSVAMNIIILSLVGTTWSFLSTRIAYKGMRSSYPDDLVFSKGRGRVEVSTVKKGSKNCNVFPPDIINHFPIGDKLTKYLPKKDDTNLPKAESNFEYRQRVNKFLSGEQEENNEGK